MISELFLNNQVTDLLDEESILLTYSVADVREPDKKSATYSKTVKIPGTARNHKIFKHIFEVTNDNQFNPNAKSTALLLQGGVSVFEGYAQLLNIIKNKERIDYEIHLQSANGSLFVDMGDNLMTGNTDTTGAIDTSKDLDLSHLNHTYNRAAQINTWLAPVGTGYVYPLIDYGFTPDSVIYDSTHLFPCVYLKELVDTIFEKYGYRYSSSFFESDYFKRLVVPYSRATPPPLTTSGLATKEAMAWIGTTLYEEQATPNCDFVIPFDDDSTQPMHDAGNNFNTTTHIFTVPAVARYIVSGVINLRTRFHANAAAFGDAVASVNIRILVNGSQVYAKNEIVQVSISSAGGTDDIDEREVPYEFLVTAASPLAASDEISVDVTASYGTTVSNVDCYIGTDQYSYVSFKRAYPYIGAGDSFNANYMLPLNVKQRDFLSSVLKLFNLYVDEDRDNSGYLIIEPRDDYYNLGSIVDWSEKLDRSQDVEIHPMSELDFKELSLRYKEDGDYWNKLFKDEYGEPYGTQKIIMETDFVKEIKTIETAFSPTPLVNQSSLSSPIVPAIYSMESSGIKKMLNTNMRILYYAGTITKPWTYTENSASSSGFTYYPYAGHLDNPTSATVDLGFGAPKKIYYFSSGDIQLTNNTLFGRFYRNYIAEITDINSKLLIGWFRLTQLDIAQLRLYNIIYLDGAHWRINRIIDYNATSEGLTQIELLYVIDSPAFEPTQTVVNGTGDDPIDGVPTEMSSYGTFTAPVTDGLNQRQLWGNPNVANDTKKIAVMDAPEGGNTINSGAETIQMVGCSGCTIGAGCYNISMMNCSNISINAGVHDVVLMNCTEMDPEDITSNKVYINNLEV